ncbi:MAG: GHKL domain-containing protein [Clostridiales bacterium]|nr:GHKL domain-containing protein [Clostridiales bacterium]
MLKQLRWKFVLINMILVTLVLTIVFAAVLAFSYRRLEMESTQAMERVLRSGNTDFPKREIGGGKPPNEKEPPKTMTAAFYVELNADGAVKNVFGENVTVTNEAALDAIVANVLAQERSSGTVRGESLRFLIQGNRIAFADRTNEIESLTSLLETSALVGFFGLLAFFGISLFLARWALRPIEKSWRQQRQFVADASHELKTPLTVILANMGIVLSHREETVQSQIKWLEYTQAEASRMKELVGSLLFLAQADDMQEALALSEVNFSDVVWSSVLPFESVAFEQNKTLASDIANNVVIRGNEDRLRRLTAILLDNAIKYSDECGTITLRLQKAQDKALLTVHNTGAQIPAGQLSHIFERFYRVDGSRTREKGGYGLGLSIAQSIVQSHHGRISVQSGKQGTIFTVSLPAGGAARLKK